MKILSYALNVNNNGTYNLNYDYVNEDGNTIYVFAPRVDINYVLEPLRGRENIIFPNIMGHTILE